MLSRDIVFDKIHKSIEIKEREERPVPFDDIREIRYEHDRHFGTSGGDYGESLKVTHKYSLALRRAYGTDIYIATGGEAIAGELRDEISRALGKSITYVGSAVHLEETQDQIFRAAQEKLKKRDEGGEDG